MNNLNEFVNKKLAEIQHVKEYIFNKFKKLNHSVDSLNSDSDEIPKAFTKDKVKKPKANVFEHLGDE